jgi:hypothetical protein
MTQEMMSGLPYWQFQFGQSGERVSVPPVATLAQQLSAQQITDLFVFSHGWNNSQEAARSLYALMFNELASQARSGLRPNTKLGVCGVIWPSLQWADEAMPGTGSVGVGGGGAAAFGAPPPAPAPKQKAVSDEALVKDLAQVFTTPKQKKAIAELASLLASRPNDDGQLKRFQILMRDLAPRTKTKAPPEERGQRALLDRDHAEVFDRMSQASLLAEVPPPPPASGAAGFGIDLSGRWEGAKQALRQLTYWQMKERAGVVGQQGLGKLIGELSAQMPSLRVHLIGHSFGARLVSFTLAGLPSSAQGTASPVKSVTLLQGAFSHFAFSPSLPQAKNRPGALNGMAQRVDGPLVVSFTSADTAIGIFYPWASIAAGTDASNLSDPLYPWGAMGSDGAQAVNASVMPFNEAGTGYTFDAGRFYNLDGNAFMTRGGPPAGAHGDIIYPKIAWAILSAASVVP